MEVEGECTEVFLTSFSLTFYIYYSGIFTLIQIMVCGNAREIEVVARTMRAQNLTKFFKFRTNVRSSKFDFKSQILGGRPTTNSQLQKFDKVQLVHSCHPQLPAGAQLQLLRSSLRPKFDSARPPSARSHDEHLFGTYVRS